MKKEIKESKTIWGFPFYKVKKMPRALVNEKGDWVGMIKKERLTYEEFFKRYGELIK